MDQPFAKGAAFVLGGSGMIGGAICEAFARHGVPVAFSYNSKREGAEELAARLPVESVFQQVDGGSAGSISSALATAAERFGGLHSIVYAGGPRFVPQYFSRMDEAVWLDWFHNDAMACIRLATAGLPYLRTDGGAFTAISTYQGDRVEIQGAASAVSKAAVDRMVAVVAKEEGRFGVRANALRCGWIGGERTTTLMEKLDLMEEKKKQIPLRRLGYPSEIGETVVFLSSSRAGFITGQTLTADGGEAL